MSLASCPTGTVDAPVEVVWALLTHPAGWGSFFDLRITRVDPPGSAVVGQKISARSGFRFLSFRLTLEFTEIDEDRHTIGMNVQLPFGVTVWEHLVCQPLDPAHCRVAYHCDFSFPPGWRSAVIRPLMRRELAIGPADSLSRLKHEAERRWATTTSPGPRST